MQIMKLENIEIKVHNKREEKLVRIANQTYQMAQEYYSENTFGDMSRTIRIIQHQSMTSIEGMLTSMYYMDLIDEPVNVNDLEFFKENNLHHA